MSQRSAALSNWSSGLLSDDWRTLAACRYIDPELFFPLGTGGSALDQVEAAKRVCRSCEAIEPCLQFALVTNQESGVWGGTSEDERRKLRKTWMALRKRARGEDAVPVRRPSVPTPVSEAEAL